MSKTNLMLKVEDILNKYHGKVSQILSNKKIRKTSREGNLEKVYCPNCFKHVFDFDGKNAIYVCPNCGVELSKEEMFDLARIENSKGVLIDFNIKKDVDGQKTLDHHDKYATDNMYETATCQVIDYIEFVKNHSRLEGLAFVKHYKEEIEKFAYGSHLNIFVSHLDIDGVLGVFAFRNPIYALEKKDLLIRLSQYSDLLKVDKSIRIVYLSIIGYMRYLMNSKKYGEEEMFELMLVEVKKILDNPKEYSLFCNTELAQLNKEKTIIKSLKNHIKLIPGYEDTILLYILSKEMKRDDSFYELLYESSQMLNPDFYIPNCPLIIKMTTHFDSFSLSVNPYYPGFEKIDLRPLQSIFEAAENKKVEEIIHSIEVKEDQYNFMKSRIENIRTVQEPFTTLNNIVRNMYKQKEKELIQEIVYLKQLFVNQGLNEDETLDKMILMLGYEDSKQIDKKKIIIGLKDIERKYLKDMMSRFEVLKQEVKQTNMDRYLRIKQFNDKHYIWRGKSNLIMQNTRFKNVLVYDELLQLVIKNLPLILRGVKVVPTQSMRRTNVL